MKSKIVIIDGINEFECLQNDDGSCSMACPQRVSGRDGMLLSELCKLGLHIKDPYCAIGIEGHQPHQD